jgi:hypothetical protein
MRKWRGLSLGLALAAVAALSPAPKTEAAPWCLWQCGDCGIYCPCESCRGPLPFCLCR